MYPAYNLAIGIVGILIALDYRNLAIRVYDTIACFTPGGPPDPRFSPTTVRALCGILGIVALCIFGASIL